MSDRGRGLRDGPAMPADLAAASPLPGIDLDNAVLRTSKAGVDLIEKSEGLSLSAYPLAGQWLIGYGHAGAEPGETITGAEAERLLHNDLARTEAALAGLLPQDLNDNQFSALASLAYNLGVGSFRETLVYKRLMAGDRAGAADAFLYLDSARIDGEMKELASLKARRTEERALFLTPVAGAGDG